jgi:hypothetical protein
MPKKKKKKKSYHLCNWQTIARPKHLGGWGLCNLSGFSSALAANSLWRVLLKEGLWQRVIKEKYFPSISVVRWLRTVDIKKERGSQTWRYLLNSLPLLLHWIAWSPGNGHSILIGKDNILGMGSGALLSEELIDVINRKGFHFLSQVQGESQAGRITQNWKTSDELGLTGLINTEWSLYRRTLINNGIHLQEKEDILKWTGGDCSGCITVKNVYLAVENIESWNEKLDGWKKAMWKWNCPLKIKLFT